MWLNKYKLLTNQRSVLKVMCSGPIFHTVILYMYISKDLLCWNKYIASDQSEALLSRVGGAFDLPEHDVRNDEKHCPWYVANLVPTAPINCKIHKEHMIPIHFHTYRKRSLQLNGLWLIHSYREVSFISLSLIMYHTLYAE